MIVCLCRGVCDRTVRAAIARGAATVDEVIESCGAGSDCRGCCEMLDLLIDEVRGRRYSDATASRLIPTGAPA